MSDKRARRSQMLHIIAERVGASDEVIHGIPDGWKPKRGVPAGGRDECRNGLRPCPYVRCEHHLWLRAGEDREGRRWPGRTGPSSVLEMRTLTTCELDVSESKRSADDIGRYFGISARRVQQIVKRALAKLRDHAKHLAPDGPRDGTTPRGRDPTI